MINELLDYFNGDELSSSVWLNKYAQEGDKTPDDMHKRMSKEFARIEGKYWFKEKYSEDLSEYGKKRFQENFKTRGEQEYYEDRIYSLFKDFKYIIPQGSIMATLGTNQIASLSNCWVIESPLDSYAGIHKADGDLIYYYKRRGGVGMDISNLRPEGVVTNNSAKSSTGAISFMERYSNTTREVAMNGRRGALMLSIDVNHPDVLKFATIKSNKTKVTGSNISIRLNDEFMKAVENNEDYILRFPCEAYLTHTHGHSAYESLPYNELVALDYSDLKYVKKIKAKEYWDEFIKQAKDNAEPGLMYWDNILNYDPCAVYPEYKPITSNPCGEQFLQANDSCRLMVHNLFSYVKNPFTDKASFDYKLFYEHSYECMRLGDDLVDLEVEYIDRIIEKIKSDPEPDNIKQQELDLWIKSKEICLKGRRVGIGITALGDTLAALGFKYDSEEGLDVIDSIMKIKMEGELDCTVDLAILRGVFEGWDVNKEFEGYENGILKGKNDFYNFITNHFLDKAHKICDYGRRNISWSTIAPTGSVSLLADNCTSGCEPLFQPFYIRRKKINPGEEGTRVDFVDDNGDSWQEFPVLHPKFKDWINANFDNLGMSGFENIEELSKDELQKYFEYSPWYGSTANDIDWKKRIEIQSILQKYTTNAISSTINLPSTITEKEVSNIYMYGWKKGLKGQTIYVDGSRSGVLINNDTKNNSKFEYHDAPKRPKELKGEAHITKIKGKEYSVVIGLMYNKPYEVFFDTEYNLNGKGVIKKQSKKNYIFIQGNDEYTLTDYMTDEQVAITRLVSGMLRHGSDIKFVVEQLNKCDGDLFSFTKGLARVLKKYIPDGAKSTVTCNDCGSNNVIFEEGCNKCLDCGSTKCG